MTGRGISFAIGVATCVATVTLFGPTAAADPTVLRHAARPAKSAVTKVAHRPVTMRTGVVESAPPTPVRLFNFEVANRSPALVADVAKTSAPSSAALPLDPSPLATPPTNAQVPPAGANTFVCIAGCR